MSKFKVLHNYVIVSPKKEVKMVGGVEVSNDTDRYIRAEVVDSGPHSNVKTGDVVYFDKAAAKKITIEGEQYKVLSDQDLVIAV